MATIGLDYHVGHPRRLLCEGTLLQCCKHNVSKDLGEYSAWPQVADAVIEAKGVTETA
jgi:hypothetical protein